MRVVDVVRSVEVGRIIVRLLSKLRDALKSPFVKEMESYGVERAKVLSARAVEWGHLEALGWAKDISFVRYLTLLAVNTPLD